MTATSRPSIPASKVRRASESTALITAEASPSAARLIVLPTQITVKIAQPRNRTAAKAARAAPATVRPSPLDADTSPVDISCYSLDETVGSRLRMSPPFHEAVSPPRGATQESA